MKKKLSLMISLLAVLSVTSVSFLSCDLVNRFRPSGVYTSKEYTNEEDGKTYRFLMKFEEENATKDYCKGKVKYAYQYKEQGSNIWKTEKVYSLSNLTYHIVFKKNDVNMINTPHGNPMFVKSFSDDQNATLGSSPLYNVPLEKFVYNAKEIIYGYKITHIEYEFPTSKD